MAAIPDKIQTWQMVEPGKEGKPGKYVVQKTTIPMPELGEDDALVESRRLRRVPHRPGLLL